MQINVTYDPSVSNAPAEFTAAVDAAVAYYEETFDAPGTINITIGWGTVGGDTIPDGALGATTTDGIFLNYQELRNALWADARTSDALTAAENLPAADPTNGGAFFMTSAQAKTQGLIPSQDSSPDGQIVIDPTADYTFDPDNRAVAGKIDLIGVLEHEIGHVLGRVSYLGYATPGGASAYGALDIFRYASPGVLSPSSVAASFSIDGQTLLLPFNNPLNGGDTDDWSSNLTGDAFDAFGDVGVQEQISATDITMLDVFGFHAHQSPFVTTLPGTPPASGTTLSDGAQIAQGQTLYFSDLSGFTLEGSATNAGTIINVTGAGGGWAIGVDYQNVPRNAVFTNTATGSVMVTDSGYSTSYAVFYPTALGTGIVNAGLIQSVSTGGNAYGIESDSIFGGGITNSASGILRVWGKYNAVGVNLQNGGSFNNQGAVDVVGDTSPGDPAHGIDPTTGAIGIIGLTSLDNSGLIKVTSTYGDSPSIGVIFSKQGLSGPVTNSGTIIADIAFYLDEWSAYLDVSAPFETDVNIINSGTIIGAIELGNGHNQVHNSGVIAGNIHFENTASIYDGASGHLYGDIFLGNAVNTVTLGNDGDTVYGGGGTDTITGGSGDDTFMIARGNNHLDGAGGYNTLSLEGAAGGYSVNLGVGTAVGAGTSTIANIQRVIGSDFADTLIAGNSAATLIGGGGADILRGGAGADTLVAGPGGDTLTGNGGNDSFIYSAGDQQVVITDFRANGDQDVLKIFGYGSAQSIQQQGADTLITLSGSDTVLLKNVLASSLTGSALTYNAADFLPPLTSSPLPVFGTRPIYLNYHLKIYSNETVSMDFGLAPQSASAIIMDDSTNSMYTSRGTMVRTIEPGLENCGHVSIASTGGALKGVDVGTIGIVQHTVTFANETGATFTVDNANGQAWGIYAPDSAPNVINAGVFSVSSYGTPSSQAMGAYTYDRFFSFNNTATGSFSVTSDASAWGLNLQNGGVFRNDGQFNVSGVGTVYGVYEDNFAVGESVTNNGSFTVTGASGSTTYGFVFRGTDDVQFAPVSFVNTGTISAQTAIQSINTIPGITPYQAPSLKIQNSGTINGNIDLGGSRSIVSNTGTINGNILIHDDYAGYNYFYVNYGPGDTIDLRGGTFNGNIEVAPGSAGDVAIPDVIYTGTATTTVKIDGGQSNLALTVSADPFGHTTIQYDIASNAAHWSKNADGSWTVSAGSDGTQTLINILCNSPTAWSPCPSIIRRC